MIKANPEMQTYSGLDFHPVAHEKASTLSKVDDKLLISGVDGIVMDLGMSSMQAQKGKAFKRDLEQFPWISCEARKGGYGEGSKKNPEKLNYELDAGG
ncbi:hypothetical protein Tco_0652949 [Tanacetum coccineum]|uniref:Uncharacterized protein n=1 Tax=Tanacetum coccineum TaxID=301880 RepID=A0ABQ4WZT3_9ASTR